MRHSGNTVKVISGDYTGDSARVKVYVYDELDRFVTMGYMTITRDNLDWWQGGMNLAAQRRQEQQQDMLPPWQ